MDLKITIEVTDAQPAMLKDALSGALAATNIAERLSAGSVDKHAEVRLGREPARAEAPKPARKRKAKTETAPVEIPEAVPAENPAAEPAPAPVPEPEPAAAPAEPEPAAAPAENSAALDLEDVRREFTRVAKKYPEGRKAINAILIEAEAHSLNALTPDKFEWALGKLKDWEAAQK